MAYRYCFLILFLLCAWPISASTTVYFTKPAILKWAFPVSQEIVTESFRVSNKPAIFYVGKVKHKPVGYLYIGDEVGKHQPITFAVLLDPNGVVKGMQVMAYREVIGDGIRVPQFLKQFIGKTQADPIRLSKDIDGVSGATYSSLASTVFVRKALALFKSCYKEARVS